MWERFTERAKHVVSMARETAIRLGSDYVRTEYILLALCGEPEGIAARSLKNLGVDIEALAASIQGQMQSGTPTVTSDDLTFTPRAKKMLELTVDEARSLNHSYIGTEHMLLGLLEEEDGISAAMLRDIHVDYRRAKQEILGILGQGVAPETLAKEEAVGFAELAPAELLIVPGNASTEDIADFFFEISKLYRMLGGEGIYFDVEDCRELKVMEMVT